MTAFELKERRFTEGSGTLEAGHPGTPEPASAKGPNPDIPMGQAVDSGTVDAGKRKMTELRGLARVTQGNK